MLQTSSLVFSQGLFASFLFIISKSWTKLLLLFFILSTNIVASTLNFCLSVFIWSIRGGEVGEECHWMEQRNLLRQH